MKSQTLEEWIAENGGPTKFFPIEQLARDWNGFQIEGPRIVRSTDGRQGIRRGTIPSIGSTRVALFQNSARYSM